MDRSHVHWADTPSKINISRAAVFAPDSYFAPTPARSAPEPQSPSTLENHGFDVRWSQVPLEPIQRPNFNRPSAFRTPPPASSWPPVAPVKQVAVSSEPELGLGIPALLILVPAAVVHAGVMAGINAVKASVGFLSRMFGGAAKVVGGGAASGAGNVGGASRSRTRYSELMRKLSRHNPLRRTPKRQLESMLAYPPYVVGATPRIIKESYRLRADIAATTSTPGSSRSQTSTPGSSPSQTDSQLANWDLFHEKTPRPKKVQRKKLASCLQKTPSTKGRRHVHFAPSPESTPAKNTDAPQTPRFRFDTPQRKRAAMPKNVEFMHNMNVSKFDFWLDFIHNNGHRIKDIQAAYDDFRVPESLIEELFNDPERWGTLVQSLSHDGFLKRLGINVPKAPIAEPKDWTREQLKQVPLDPTSPQQQKDGCCRFCRGQPWAGKVYSREVDENGDIPVRSEHASVKPYTDEEVGEFKNGEWDSLHRRHCRESRWDWVFEEPVDVPEWEIPTNDPRIRHILRWKNIPRAYKTREHLAGLQKEFSRQDLIAKRFYDAIKKENFPLGEAIRKMDLERKRRQVNVDFLCIRQIRVVARGSHQALPTAPQPGSKRSRADSDQEEVCKRSRQSRESDNALFDPEEFAEWTAKRNVALMKRAKMEEAQSRKKKALQQRVEERKRKRGAIAKKKMQAKEESTSEYSSAGEIESDEDGLTADPGAGLFQFTGTDDDDLPGRGRAFGFASVILPGKKEKEGPQNKKTTTSGILEELGKTGNTGLGTQSSGIFDFNNTYTEGGKPMIFGRNFGR